MKIHSHLKQQLHFFKNFFLVKLSCVVRLCCQVSQVSLKVLLSVQLVLLLLTENCYILTGFHSLMLSDGSINVSERE